MHIYSFFPLLLTYQLVLFLLFYFPISTLFSFAFPVCALVSFDLEDIIFGFLCLPGQSLALYFCWTVLVLLMDVYVYVYIQSQFYCCYKPMLYVGLLQFCGVFLFLFFFSLFYNFNF